MSRPYIDFAALKTAVAITSVLERYGLMAGLRPCGADSLRGKCPIHRGDNPKEFSVSRSKNCWHCFSPACDGGGNVLDLVARLEDVDIHRAAELLNEWFALGLDARRPQAPRTPKNASPTPREDARRSETREPAATAPKEAESSSDSSTAHVSPPDAGPPVNPPLGFALRDLDPAHPYFAERGLEPRTVEHFGLGFCAKGTMAGRVVIPLHDPEGRLVGYAGRWPGEPPEGRPKYKLPKGFVKTVELFNFHRLGPNDDMEPLIVVEGYFDCMWLWQMGFPHCVAIAGSSLSDHQEALLARRLAESEVPHLDVFLDNDEAGRKGADEVVIRLATRSYVRRIVPTGDHAQPDGLDVDELGALLR